MSLKLVLRDNTEIELADGSIAKHFTVVCATKEDFVTIWSKLTLENLSEVRLMDGDATICILTNLILIGTQTMDNSDGSITGHFYTDGGEFLTDEYAEAGRILLGEGV